MHLTGNEMIMEARIKYIKPFCPEHADGVVSLILPIQQAEFGIPITLQGQPDLLDIPGFYQHGCGNFWVVLEAGEVIGSIALLDIGNSQGALRKMFVAAKHRGAGQGVADALLETLLAWCRGQGVREIYLGTTEKFLAAHRFYEKNGFSELTRAGLPERFPVMAVDSKFYMRTP
jgi:GNAT superfamily N-acetyltransferase